MDATYPDRRFRVRRLGEATSTNQLALEAAASGEPEGLVIVADHQTAGRGRLGRSWTAPPGTALLTSVLLRPPNPVTHMAVTAVGCAAAAACARVAGYEPGLKWPNDLVAPVAGGWRKLGGILAEATASEGNMAAVVVGLGLNVRPPDDRPDELRDIATDLDVVSGSHVDRDALLDAILAELEPRYAALVERGPAELLAEYRRRCVTVGQRVRVEQPHRVLEGIAVGVDESGALLVEDTPGVTTLVDVGDVVHLRPA